MKIISRRSGIFARVDIFNVGSKVVIGTVYIFTIRFLFSKTVFSPLGFPVVKNILAARICAIWRIKLCCVDRFNLNRTT